MTASITLNEYLTLEFKNAEDANTIKNTISAIEKEFVNCYPKPKEDKEKEIKADYEKLLNSLVLSVKICADASYKTSASLETKEIEQIKNSLNNYAGRHDKIKEFKKELIEDLTEFQKQIRTNYTQKLAGLEKQKRFCEKQVRVFEFEKNKLIMNRLSRIIWPYDKQTKEYDNKIAKLQIQLQKYGQKIEQLQKMQPTANEKDVLIYQMHLKEKYSKK